MHEARRRDLDRLHRHQQVELAAHH